MTNAKTNRPSPGEVENYFGGCPVCGKTDGFLNVIRCHWFVCDAHKTRWYVGSNLFSCWRDQDTAHWCKNKKILGGFTEVTPIRYLRDRRYNLPVWDGTEP